MSKKQEVTYNSHGEAIVVVHPPTFENTDEDNGYQRMLRERARKVTVAINTDFFFHLGVKARNGDGTLLEADTEAFLQEDSARKLAELVAPHARRAGLELVGIGADDTPVFVDASGNDVDQKFLLFRIKGAIVRENAGLLATALISHIGYDEFHSRAFFDFEYPLASFCQGIATDANRQS